LSISIPEILSKHLKKEAKRFDMGPEELIATILQTHQFKDEDRQLILLAIEVARSTKKKRRRARQEAG